jgi:hypothetical protein
MWNLGGRIVVRKSTAGGGSRRLFASFARATRKASATRRTDASTAAPPSRASSIVGRLSFCE